MRPFDFCFKRVLLAAWLRMTVKGGEGGRVELPLTRTGQLQWSRFVGGKDSDLAFDQLSLGGLLDIQVEMWRMQLVYRQGVWGEVQAGLTNLGVVSIDVVRKVLRLDERSRGAAVALSALFWRFGSVDPFDS